MKTQRSATGIVKRFPAWPKVTVVISTYKRPKMLLEALRSVLNQTFEDFEVWVVDDASSTAKEVCEGIEPEFAARGVDLTCLNLPENSGYQAVPKNHAIQLCHGSYIAYLDDDNLYDPDHLTLLMDKIEETGADIVYSRWRYTGGNADTDAPFTQPSPPALVGLCKGPQMNFIDTSAILHSKAALRARFGGSVWDDRLMRFGDWDLAQRCVTAGLKFEAIDEVTFTYRWHGNNLQITRPTTGSTVYSEATPTGRGWGGKRELGL